ncbi:hypothetical protein GGR61_003909 [Xanthomonas arboricola]|nr:hypothetical protein [Xanthomonas sp. 3058]
METDAQDYTQISQLNKVQSAFAAFILAYIGLRLAQGVCHIGLSQVGLIPQIAKQVSKQRVAVLSLSHWYNCRAGLLSIPIQDILCA